MRKALVPAALIAASLLLFFIANRAAYQGYFHGDDLSNILWSRLVPADLFLKGYLSPQLMKTNFRPVGHLFFRIAGETAGLRFRWYVFAIHLLLFLNVWLVWKLARKAGLGTWAAAAGCAFFAFHMGVFNAIWKPMYVFDVLCATFCLLSLLCWAGRRWVLSFVFFWTAYKSKEFAVMLPAVLLCWELWLGKREWKKLIPFFAVSAWFGVQALFSKAAAGTDWEFRYDAASIWKCIGFYASKFVLIGKPALAVAAALILAAAAVRLVKDRAVWFGVAGAVLLLTPMLLMPGRLDGAYLYGPLALASLAFAATAGRVRPAWAVAVFFALWLPLNYVEMRKERKAALTLAMESRAYVETLAASRSAWSGARTVVLEGEPAGLFQWGSEAAVRLLSRPEMDVQRPATVHWSTLKDEVAIVGWDPIFRRMRFLSGRPDTPQAAYIAIDRTAPVWQFGEGWYQRENRLCWTQPRAWARLVRPAAAREFELAVNVPGEQLSATGRPRVAVVMDGVRIGTAEFENPGLQTVRWAVPPAPAGISRIDFEVDPPFRPASEPNPRTLGIAVAAFGFK